MYRAIIILKCLFCNECINKIKIELALIKGISYIHINKKEASISFNFTKANHISTVENYLSSIGLHPIEDKIIGHHTNSCFCFLK